MAEGEATVRAASDGGEGSGARMVGGSLPPRKRLLAGLKQNSSWSASSSPASVTVLTVGHRPEGGLLASGTVSALRSSPSEVVTGEAKGGCTSCGTLESDAWRKTKRNGVPQFLCDVCYVSYDKNVQCPRCQGVYPDVKDPAVWLECCRCQRNVHCECERRVPSQLNAGPYMCPDCVVVKNDEEHGNLSTKAPSGRPGFNCDTEAGNRTLSSATECPTPSDKKPRVSREPRGKTYDVEVANACNLEEIPNSTKILLGRKGSTSKEAAAAAAAAAAVLAGRVAAAAKASAAAKAATAVKAAAMAKAALDAAAVAARVEAQLRQEKAEETEVKIQAVTSLSSVDDEELARQLHRAINSSPRISSGLTPLRRKPSTKPAVIFNVSQAVTSSPRFGLSAESEPRLQIKQQQTRPRSLQLKEVKGIDFREVKLEPKPFGWSNRAKVSQLHCGGASGNFSELLALKSEPADSSTVTLVRQVSGTIPLQGATSTPLDVATKTENGLMNRATAVLRGLDDSQDLVLPGTDVSQAAALLDEVLSEADEDEASKEEYLSRLQYRPGEPLKEDLDALARTIVEGPAPCTQLRLSEEGRELNDGDRTANVNMSSVAALVQVASCAMELLENQGTSGSADGTGPTGRDTALEDGRTVEKFGHLTAKASLSIPVGCSGAASGVEISSELETVPQPSSAGKEWKQVVFKGVARSGQALAGGVHAGSLSSELAIRPNLNS